MVALLAMASPASELPSVAPFRGTHRPVPPEMREQMTGVSWFPDCPIPIEGLALLELSYWGFDGLPHDGRLVVAASVATPVLAAFRALYDARFPIERMQTVESFGGDDERSMAANNTSGFNCRRVMGAKRWSRHAYGTAVDLNPVQNPYLRGAEVHPPAAARYLTREDVRPGMIVRNGAAYRAFRDVGWKWGGLWRGAKDYQHFSATGR